jgi:hypothetical protein
MMKRILITAGLSLALMLCLSGTYTGATAQAPSTGQKLVGTWDVTLRFPVCSMACQCPGGVPGTLFRSDALGSWEHVRDQEYSARYKFFIFNPTTGLRILTEIVTSQIELQGRDAFDAAATFDLFAADGSTISTGC